MNSENDEIDLFHDWFLDISKDLGTYKEPVLGSNSAKFFKQICDAFEQNTHVFILTLELAEDYIQMKQAKKQKIRDLLLAAVTIAFVCHKCEGAPEVLKIKHVVDLLFHFTKKWYRPSEVMAMEGDIIVTLNGKLPIATVLDDMDIIIERYMCDRKFKANVRPLCLKILELIYMDRRRWFKELKEIYSQNRDCLVVFKHLLSSKLYIPLSVLLVAIELSQYRHVVDANIILADVSKLTKIHEHHVKILVAKMIEVFNEA